jgi:hypothetical protein
MEECRRGCAFRRRPSKRSGSEFLNYLRRRKFRMSLQYVSKTARETVEIVALFRELREKMGLVEELEPDNRMLREYRNLRGWAIIELRRVRALTELDLQRRDISRRQRKVAAEQLHFVALVESEIGAESGRDTAH